MGNEERCSSHTYWPVNMNTETKRKANSYGKRRECLIATVTVDFYKHSRNLVPRIGVGGIRSLTDCSGARTLLTSRFEHVSEKEHSPGYVKSSSKLLLLRVEWKACIADFFE